jgi:hypothetical protein
MQTVIYTRGPPLHYSNPYPPLPAVPHTMMYNPIMRPQMPQCSYMGPPPLPYCPAPPIPQMNVQSASVQAMNGNSVHNHLVNGNQTNTHLVNNGTSVNNHLVNGNSVNNQLIKGNSVSMNSHLVISNPVDDPFVNGSSVNSNPVSGILVKGQPAKGCQLNGRHQSIEPLTVPSEGECCTLYLLK